jgi:hypothetical protein
MPEHVANLPAFMKATARNKLRIEQASDEVLQRYALQHAQAQAAEEAQARGYISQLDHQPQNDIVFQEQGEGKTMAIVGATCIAPGPGGYCGGQVMMRQNMMNEKPPLCDAHGHLVHEFFPSPHPTETDERGTPKTIWTRAAIGAPALGSQQLPGY